MWSKILCDKFVSLETREIYLFDFALPCSLNTKDKEAPGYCRFKAPNFQQTQCYASFNIHFLICSNFTKFVSLDIAPSCLSLNILPAKYSTKLHSMNMELADVYYEIRYDTV